MQNFSAATSDNHHQTCKRNIILDMRAFKYAPLLHGSER